MPMRYTWKLLEMEASGTFCYTRSSQVYINPCSFPSIDTSLTTGYEPGDTLLTPTCLILASLKSRCYKLIIAAPANCADHHGRSTCGENHPFDGINP